MALNSPTLKQVLERSRSDIRGVLTALDPSKPKSFIRAIVDSNSGRAFDAYTLLKQVLKQLFPQSAEDDYLNYWGEYDGLQLIPAQAASGYIVIQGTSIVTIPLGTLFNSVPGNQYETTEVISLATISQNLSSAVADADKVITCETASPHSLATGILATFTGLTNNANTTDAEITVIDDYTFSFVAPNVNTTGSVLGSGAYTFLGAKVAIESVDSGSDKNLGSGSVLSIVTPISGVETEAYVYFDELTGGTDTESSDSYRERILSRRANPVANFNAAAIEKQVRAIPTVTKVYISPVTPYAGAVTIYFFVQDGDSLTGIPNPAQITDVLNSVLEIKPITVVDADVIVLAPNTVSVAHTITGLSPNTATMQSAIMENLIAFYEDQADLGLDITTDMIKLAIQNSQDLSTGEFPTAFTLSTPAATTVISSSQIAIYGGVTFA